MGRYEQRLIGRIICLRRIRKFCSVARSIALDGSSRNKIIGFISKTRGERNGLLLSRRKVAAALADRQVITERMERDKIVDAGELASLDEVGIRGAWIGEQQIGFNRPDEKIGILHDQTDSFADFMRMILAQIDAIDEDFAFSRRVESPATNRPKVVLPEPTLR